MQRKKPVFNSIGDHLMFTDNVLIAIIILMVLIFLVVCVGLSLWRIMEFLWDKIFSKSIAFILGI
jgi:hypothetical protein